MEVSKYFVYDLFQLNIYNKISSTECLPTLPLWILTGYKERLLNNKSSKFCRYQVNSLKCQKIQNDEIYLV